jgi:hypothetical protein
MTPPVRSDPFVPAALKDVAAFIHAQQGEPPVAAGPAGLLSGTREIPIDPNLQKFVEGRQTGESDKLPEPDIPQELYTQAGLPTQARLQSNILTDGLPAPAELTQAEKDIYVKAVCFDTPVVWDIPVLGGAVSVRCRTLTLQQEDVIAWWLHWGEASKLIIGTSMWCTWLCRAGARLRVLSIEADGRATNYAVPALDKRIEDEHEAAMLDNEARLKLVLHFHDQVEVFTRMTPVARLGIMQQAVGVHEHKFITCTKSAASGNFWPPAGRA